jgi:hypothetical protein
MFGFILHEQLYILQDDAYVNFSESDHIELLPYYPLLNIQAKVPHTLQLMCAPYVVQLFVTLKIGNNKIKIIIIINYHKLL